MRQPNRLGLLISALMLYSVSGFVFAETYKWTDDEGNVHYSQQPPPGDIKAKTMDTPNAGSEAGKSEVQRRLEAFQKRDEKREEAEQERQRQQKKAEIYRKNCQTAKDRLAKLQRGRQVRAFDEDGNMRRLSVEEHQQRIDNVKKDVEKYCNPS